MAAETHLIPVSELAPAQVGAIRNQAIAAVVNLAASELKISPDKITTRDIRPSDLDYTNDDWFEVTGATANVYETWTTGTMGTDRWIVFWGVMDEGVPACTLVNINIGGGVRAIWNLQQLPTNEAGERIGFTNHPVIVTPNAIYTIQRYVRLVNSPSHLVLKGAIIEPRGRVVSP